MVTSVLQDQQYMFGVRSLLVDEKVLLMKNDLADVLFQQLIRRSDFRGLRSQTAFPVKVSELPWRIT